MKPPETTCPICDKELQAEKEEFEHAQIKGVKKGFWWYYNCNDCRLSFTTTESDTISMDKWYGKRKNRT